MAKDLADAACEVTITIVSGHISLSVSGRGSEEQLIDEAEELVRRMGLDPGSMSGYEVSTRLTF